VEEEEEGVDMEGGLSYCTVGAEEGAKVRCMTGVVVGEVREGITCMEEGTGVVQGVSTRLVLVVYNSNI